MRGIGKNSIVYNYCAKRKQKHLVQTVMVLRGVDDSTKGRLYVTVPVPAVFGGSPIHFWREAKIFLAGAKNKREPYFHPAKAVLAPVESRFRTLRSYGLQLAKLRFVRRLFILGIIFNLSSIIFSL